MCNYCEEGQGYQKTLNNPHCRNLENIKSSSVKKSQQLKSPVLDL